MAGGAVMGGGAYSGGGTSHHRVPVMLPPPPQRSERVLVLGVQLGPEFDEALEVAHQTAGPSPDAQKSYPRVPDSFALCREAVLKDPWGWGGKDGGGVLIPPFRVWWSTPSPNVPLRTLLGIKHA